MAGAQFGKVPRWLFQSPNVSDAAVRVYAYLAWLASPGDECFPSVAAIGEGAPRRDDAGELRARSRSSVLEALAELEAAGAIQRRRRAGRVTTYRVFASPLNVVAASQTTLELDQQRVHSVVDKRRAHG